MLYSSAPYGYNNVAYGAPAYGAAYGGVYGAPAYASSFGGPVRTSVVGGAPLVGATSFVGGAPLLGGAQLVGGPQLVGGAPLVSSGYVGSPVVYNQAPLATSFVGAPALTSSYVQGGAYAAPLRTSFVASGAPVLGGPVGGFVNSPARYAGVAYDDVSSSDDERWSPIRGSYTRGLRRSFGGNYSAGPYGRYAAPRRSYGGGAPLARYDAYDECGCENINLTSRGAGRLSRLRNKLF